jgi:predicted transcriptional regulator
MAEENASDVRQMASDIVAAYVSNNQMRADEVPDFIQKVMSALAVTGAQGAEPPAPAEAQTPAVSIRKSVQDDAVTCLECGAAQKTLKRHIGTAHGLSEAEYRGKWNLPADHPLVAPAYSRERSAMAKKIGLGKGGRAARKRR